MTDVADSTPNTHIFFVEKGEEKEFDIAKKLDTHPSLINRKSNRPRLADITKIALPEVEEVSQCLKHKVYLNLWKYVWNTIKQLICISKFFK